MHIKIISIVSRDDDDVRWEIDNSYKIDQGSEREFVVPIEDVQLRKTMVSNYKMGIYNSSRYHAYIPAKDSGNIALSLTEEEYHRIERVLSFHNKHEVASIASVYPEIDAKTAIEDLQLEE